MELISQGYWRMLVALGVAFVLLAGCFRGQPKERPPIHPVPDMDVQPRYMSQSDGEFFENDMSMRSPVYGTVARDYLHLSDSLYRGMDADDNPIQNNPMDITMDLLERGQRQYNIYCAPCHSQVGDGRGIMLEYNYVPPASFHTDRIRNVADGHIYDVITNGLRNMPGYSHQISVEDRWAIIGYVRALQRSQNAALSDIPAEERTRIE